MPKLSYQKAREALGAARAEGEMSAAEMQAVKRALDAGMPLPDETMRRLLHTYLNRFLPNVFEAIRALQQACDVPASA